MELRARYISIGAFVLAVVAATFVFIYWLQRPGGIERTVYDLRFTGSVSGLLIGSPVLYNGLRVGEVSDIRLNPQTPSEVIVLVSVASGTPVRADTNVSLAFNGLTGVPTLSLTAGPVGIPFDLTAGQVPVLMVPAEANQDVMTAARATLQRIDQVIDDNAEPLKATIGNIRVFSESLARNSGRLDQIAEGLAGMFGGNKEEKTPGNYALSVPAEFPAAAVPAEGQLSVEEPKALILYDTQRFLVRDGDATRPELEDAKWSDSLPLLIRATVIEAFQAAGFPRVGRSETGMLAEHQLLLEIRDFTVHSGPKPEAQVEIAAQIASDAGDIIDTKVFRATSPVADMSADRVAEAFVSAFQAVLTDLVPWTLGAI